MYNSYSYFVLQGKKNVELFLEKIKNSIFI